MLKIRLTTNQLSADETTNSGLGKIRQAIYKEKVLFPWLNILITSFSAVTEMPELARVYRVKKLYIVSTLHDILLPDVDLLENNLT